ncbi:hypothetical protein FB451DRAFT_1193488 [Mycena latifolia]|nr:hypothetical protein FB451DRAFT_1193488 [Mycena latifolia]
MIDVTPPPLSFPFRPSHPAAIPPRQPQTPPRTGTACRMRRDARECARVPSPAHEAHLKLASGDMRFTPKRPRFGGSVTGAIAACNQSRTAAGVRLARQPGRAQRRGKVPPARVHRALPLPTYLSTYILTSTVFGTILRRLAIIKVCTQAHLEFELRASQNAPLQPSEKYSADAGIPRLVIISSRKCNAIERGTPSEPSEASKWAWGAAHYTLQSRGDIYVRGRNRVGSSMLKPELPLATLLHGIRSSWAAISRVRHFNKSEFNLPWEFKFAERSRSREAGAIVPAQVYWRSLPLSAATSTTRLEDTERVQKNNSQVLVPAQRRLEVQPTQVRKYESGNVTAR